MELIQLSFYRLDGLKCGQDIWLSVVDGYGMLKMGCPTHIAGDDILTVRHQGYGIVAPRNHGLNGDTQTILE